MAIRTGPVKIETHELGNLIFREVEKQGRTKNSVFQRNIARAMEPVQHRQAALGKAYYEGMAHIVKTTLQTGLGNSQKTATVTKTVTLTPGNGLAANGPISSRKIEFQSGRERPKQWPRLTDDYWQRKVKKGLHHDVFWLYTGTSYDNVSTALKALDRYTIDEYADLDNTYLRQLGGPLSWRIEFALTFPSLGHGVLNDLLRTPFVTGTVGEPPDYLLYAGDGGRQGMARILWPESHRPFLMRLAKIMGTRMRKDLRAVQL